MLTAMGDVMREAYRRNWITTRDGNVAVRKKDSNIINLTPSGVRKVLICPEMIVKMKLEPEIIFTSGLNLTPTGEWDMHYRILKDAKSTTATVHLHPPHIVAAMHAGWELSEMVKPFPEVFRYTRVGLNVQDWNALSKELAEDTASNLGIDGPNRKFDVVGQKSHGATAVGKDPWEAFEHIERVEHIAQIVLTSGKQPPQKNNKKFKNFIYSIY
jgi:ribulose-5-phosphate 4-epimerase/fuculose-1-phosphate aldolase